jgi:hypothetical protein
MAIGGAEDKLGDRTILSHFVRLAGGDRARIVVLATASSLGDELAGLVRSRGGTIVSRNDRAGWVVAQLPAGAAPAVLGSDGQAGDLGGRQRPSAPPDPLAPGEQETNDRPLLVLEHPQLLDRRACHGALRGQLGGGIAECLSVLEDQGVVLFQPSRPIPAGHALPPRVVASGWGAARHVTACRTGRRVIRAHPPADRLGGVGMLSASGAQRWTGPVRFRALVSICTAAGSPERHCGGQPHGERPQRGQPPA